MCCRSEFSPGESVGSVGITGLEVFDLIGTGVALRPRSEIVVRATAEDGSLRMFTVIARIDTPEEVTAFLNGGILPYVLRQLVRRQ